MRTVEERDAVVELANASLKAWPTFESLPEVEGVSPIEIEVIGETNDIVSYAQAMYEMCSKGTPVGRNENFIVGK